MQRNGGSWSILPGTFFGRYTDIGDAKSGTSDLNAKLREHVIPDAWRCMNSNPKIIPCNAEWSDSPIFRATTSPSRYSQSGSYTVDGYSSSEMRLPAAIGKA